ncbi:Chalcone--flavonone isomerase [Dichanthelium oligosanthes]|uniref:Chalcone-flavonone isomerase family protein n=1 Tax=Dichanthelium oligosanthes TaxID=888268 RepID=A0A1E5UYM9_9POAL|nr:Chalcone--flavonone isomerase [Dichanthelium oligosanthes]
MAVSSEVTVEGVVFPPVARPPGSVRAHFLAGGGVRGMEAEGNFFKIAAIGVYLEDAAVPALAGKWAGKTADELASDPAFFRDVYTGEFEKFTRVTFIWPNTVPAEEFAAKVMESRVAYLESTGAYTDAEAVAVEEFKVTFKPHSLAPGDSVLFTHSPAGVLTVAFSGDSSVPVAGIAAIENKALCEAVLESIIGERSVSPATKQSIATRLPEILKGGGGA